MVRPDGGAGAPRSSELLQRIGSLLDLPITAFSELRSDRVELIIETSTLLASFSVIKDPDLRARCLVFVLMMADEDKIRSKN